MAKPIKAFLDTSVLFAALLSETGGSRLILKLGEAGALQLLLSRQILSEAEGALKRKAPDAMPLFSMLLERARVEIVDTAPRKTVRRLQPAVGHAGDTQIAADALVAKADYLITLDKAHLLENSALAEAVPYAIGSPGEFIAWYRVHVGAD